MIKENKPVTFLNQPYLGNRENARAMVSLTGICVNSSYEDRGVETGPDAVRRVSLRYANGDGSSQPIKIYNPERGFILDGVTIEDTGNIITGSDPEITERLIENEIRKLLYAGSFPLSIGGDHYVTFPIVSAYEGPITVVQLDAHGDYLPLNCGFPHGYVMRRVSNLPQVRRVIHCGLRGNMNTGPGLDDSVRNGNVIITSGDLRRGGIQILLKEFDRNERVYVTGDVDILDPSIAPAVGVPEPGGMEYEFLRELLCSLPEKVDVRGLDFTEYNPELDINNITGVHVANLIFEFLSSRFKKK